jgi:hypothetical protein
VAPRRRMRVEVDPVVEEDPTAPDYNPVMLARLLERPSREVFAAEPRDDAWAADFEAALWSLVDADLAEDVPQASVEAIECRTSSCRVVVSAPASELDLASSYVQSFVPVGQRVSVASGDVADGRGELVFHGLLPPELRDPEHFSDWQREYRKSREDALARFREYRDSDAEVPR